MAAHDSIENRLAVFDFTYLQKRVLVRGRYVIALGVDQVEFRIVALYLATDDKRCRCVKPGIGGG